MSIPFKFNPLGISGKFIKPLRLTATQDSSSVKLTKTGSPNVSGLKYRLSSSDPWSTYTIDTVIDLDKDEYVEFINSNNSLSLSYNDYVQFVMTGKIAATGNVQSLANYEKIVGYYRFNHLFYNCSSLVSAPELLSKSVSYGSYAQMFYGCSSLTTAPELPATSVGIQGYYQMFTNCTALVNVPSKLPAKQVTNSCYARMFYGCTSLVTPPALPATTLDINCYMYMFYGCTSLTSAPALPATTVYSQSYTSMFYNCNSLVSAPALPATTLANDCYSRMFYGCTSLRSTPNLPALTLANNCYYSMFEGCTGLIVGPTMNATTLATNSCVTMFSGCSLLQSIIVKFSNWGDSSATNNWLLNVASTGTFTKPGGLAEIRGASNIPTGWSIANSYKRDLDYLESTGTQYIDTGYIFDAVNKGSAVEIEMLIPSNSTTSNMIFGTSDQTGLNAIYLISNAIFHVGDQQNYYHENPGISLAQVSNLHFVNGKYSVNGGTEINTNRLPITQYSFILFGRNTAGSVSSNLLAASGTRIYNCKFYENNVLVHDFIPVMNNDDVPCLYDKVTATFKYNAGTGSFNYGELN